MLQKKIFTSHTQNFTFLVWKTSAEGQNSAFGRPLGQTQKSKNQMQNFEFSNIMPNHTLSTQFT